jgi:hypothetical protein
VSFLSRLVKGYRALTAYDLLIVKRVGLFGQFAGLLLGGIVLFLYGFWYWEIMIFFSLLLVAVDIVAVSQQINESNTLKNFMKGAR